MHRVVRGAGFRPRRVTDLAVASVLAAVAGFVLPAASLAQAVPAPTVTTVTITSPASTAAAPFRTSRQVIPLTFTSDAAGGRFAASSAGGDVPFSVFLVNGGGGTVGVGFTREGPHAVRVDVSSLAVAVGPAGAAASSPPLNVVFDRTPPDLTLQALQVNAQQGFVPYSPGTTYYTNADRVILRGRVVDRWSPAAYLRVRSRGGASPAEAVPDTTGRFELTVSLAGVDDGDLPLELLAVEIMSDGSVSDAGPPVPVRVGR